MCFTEVLKVSRRHLLAYEAFVQAVIMHYMRSGHDGHVACEARSHLSVLLLAVQDTRPDAPAKSHPGASNR